MKVRISTNIMSELELTDKPSLPQMARVQVELARPRIKNGDHTLPKLLLLKKMTMTTVEFSTMPDDPIAGAIEIINETKPEAYCFSSEVWKAPPPPGVSLADVERGMAAHSPKRKEGLLIVGAVNGAEGHNAEAFEIDRVKKRLTPIHLPRDFHSKLPLRW